MATEYLQLFTPVYCRAFREIYAEPSSCPKMKILCLSLERTTGCEIVLVLDRNMKNHRDVCYAKDEGSVSYSGLPGHIKTGFTALPGFISRFSNEHNSQSSTTDRNNETKGTTLMVITMCTKLHPKIKEE